MTTVHGLTIKVAVDPDTYPELKDATERMALEQCRADNGGEPYVVGWYYSFEEEWVDPETGITYHLPEQWVLVVESTREEPA